MNPFSLKYKKPEDKITSLFTHTLSQCNLIESLFRSIYGQEISEINRNTYEIGLQLHNKFRMPVKKAYLLSISNNGEITRGVTSVENKEGNPDAYFYDKQNQIIVLLETKIGSGVIYEDQLERHKTKVESFTSKNWKQETVTWNWVKEFLYNQLFEHYQHNELATYIINNFIGVLNDEVLGVYDENYFLWVSGNRQTLINNLLNALKSQFSNYNVLLPNGNHNEVRLMIGNSRFATFVLNQNRFILHPGGQRGYKWRVDIWNNYRIIYDQGAKYPNELSIPFTAIDENTLTLKSNNNVNTRDDYFNLINLISKTLIENPRLSIYLTFNT
ncbi:hypothetical protein [Neobacillus sp. D3-1R]|uniref:hypothetical protein n=1 Tax=Neobacillus sp. D3-1R TaxID=3445778 RepID=UPI003FA0A366